MIIRILKIIRIFKRKIRNFLVRPFTGRIFERSYNSSIQLNNELKSSKDFPIYCQSSINLSSNITTAYSLSTFSKVTLQPEYALLSKWLGVNTSFNSSINLGSSSSNILVSDLFGTLTLASDYTAEVTQ